MVENVRKKIFSLLLFVSFSAGQLSASGVQPLTDTQLHAVMGIVTNFVLGDVPVYTMKKTGQTKIYDKDGAEHTHAEADNNVSLRDDGYYQKGRTPNYIRDDVKEIVTDKITGLQWQDDNDAETVRKPWLTYANYVDCRDNGNNCDNTSGDTAAAYCETLSLGGYEDWRLPTRKELVDLVAYSENNPALNPVFQNVVSDYYWSFTSGFTPPSGYPNNRAAAWNINFSGVDQEIQLLYAKHRSNYVRCVRTGQ